MSAQHTPGPWSYHAEDLRGGRYWCVATDGGADYIVDGIHEDNNGEADARLIAAAPDLLEDGSFLLARLDELERDLLDDEVARQFNGHVAPAMARLRTAIARATGTAS